MGDLWTAVIAVVGAYAMRVDSFLLAFAGALVIPGAAMVIANRISRTRV